MALKGYIQFAMKAWPAVKWRLFVATMRQIANVTWQIDKA